MAMTVGEMADQQKVGKALQIVERRNRLRDLFTARGWGGRALDHQDAKVRLGAWSPRKGLVRGQIEIRYGYGYGYRDLDLSPEDAVALGVALIQAARDAQEE